MAAIDIVKHPPQAESSRVRNRADQLRDWLMSPRALIIVALAVIGAGLALGWNWVVAAGFAPLLLSLAPCAAMCALGVCMMGKGNASCAKPGSADNAGPPAPTSEPPVSGGNDFANTITPPRAVRNASNSTA